jgi:hypothetical protein
LERPEEDRDYVEEDSAQLTVGAALQVPAGDFDLVFAGPGKYALIVIKVVVLENEGGSVYGKRLE